MNFSFIVPKDYLHLSESSDYQRFFSGLWERSLSYRMFCQSEKDKGKKIIFSPGFSSEFDVNPVSSLKPDVVEIPMIHIKDMEFLANVISDVSPSSEIMITLDGTSISEIWERYFSVFESRILGSSVRWIGLHRQMETLSEGNSDGRVRFLSNNPSVFSHKKIWLCGIYKNPYEIVKSLFLCQKLGLNLVGADSSKPWRIAVQGRTLNQYSPYPDPFDFYQDSVPDNILQFVKEQFEGYSKTWLRLPSTE